MVSGSAEVSGEIPVDAQPVHIMITQHFILTDDRSHCFQHDRLPRRRRSRRRNSGRSTCPSGSRAYRNMDKVFPLLHNPSMPPNLASSFSRSSRISSGSFTNSASVSSLITDWYGLRRNHVSAPVLFCILRSFFQSLHPARSIPRLLRCNRGKGKSIFTRIHHRTSDIDRRYFSDLHSGGHIPVRWQIRHRAFREQPSQASSSPRRWP